MAAATGFKSPGVEGLLPVMAAPAVFPGEHFFHCYFRCVFFHHEICWMTVSAYGTFYGMERAVKNDAPSAISIPFERLAPRDGGNELGKQQKRQDEQEGSNTEHIRIASGNNWKIV